MGSGSSKPADTAATPQNNAHQHAGGAAGADTHWTYGVSCGPHAWARHFQAAGGVRQSPVNVIPEMVKFDEQLLQKPLTFSHTSFSNCSLENTGHGFKVDCNTDLSISGGPLKNAYRFAQFHLHWGCCDRWGSEHMVDGRAFPSEIHMVFWNSDKYPDAKSAVGSSQDGEALAVVGAFIENGEENARLKPIIDKLDELKKEGSKADLPQLELHHLLPDNRADYYTYPGSLTTPPCSEIVQWILLKEHITVSSEQLAKCRGLVKSDRGEFEDTFRPCCPLGTRVVRSSFQP